MEYWQGEELQPNLHTADVRIIDWRSVLQIIKLIDSYWHHLDG